MPSETILTVHLQKCSHLSNFLASSFSIIKQLMSALAVNIIIVHPWEDVVFPRAKARITIKLNISCAKVWENHQFPYINRSCICVYLLDWIQADMIYIYIYILHLSAIERWRLTHTHKFIKANPLKLFIFYSIHLFVSTPTLIFQCRSAIYKRATKSSIFPSPRAWHILFYSLGLTRFYELMFKNK